MEKQCFVDMINDGHHWFYNFSLINELSNRKSIYFFGDFTDEQEEILKNINIEFLKKHKCTSKNKFIKELYSLYYLYKVLNYCITNKIHKCCFLYLDQFVLVLPIIYPLYKLFGIEITGVLHWYPGMKLKCKLINYMLNKGVKLIVHTDNNLNILNNKNAFKVNYPLQQTKKNLNDTKFNSDKVNILYFGGTRIDKGLDILLDGLKIINSPNIVLTIAGKEETFKREFIELNKGNQNIIMDLDFISNDKMTNYFNECDIIALPYRKYFSGESGVLNESFNYAKPVIASDIEHFKNIINKYNNGIYFEAENSSDLANKLSNLIKEYDFYKHKSIIASKEYRKNHSITTFCNMFSEIIG